MLGFSCTPYHTSCVEWAPTRALLTDTFSCKVHARLVWWVYVGFHAGLIVESCSPGYMYGFSQPQKSCSSCGSTHSVCSYLPNHGFELIRSALADDNRKVNATRLYLLTIFHSTEYRSLFPRPWVVFLLVSCTALLSI
jgi:hypothetical protein